MRMRGVVGVPVPPTAADSTNELPEGAIPPPRFLLATVPGGVQFHALPAKAEAILGRGPECEIVLDFDSISRRHAHLRIGEPCILTDLGSRNGTWLLGERLGNSEARSVKYGQVFSMGPVSLLLVAPSHGADLALLTITVDDPLITDETL